VDERGQPGAGDEFLKWLFQNMWNSVRCEQVPITDEPNRGFEEFPKDHELKTFDQSDRKFVAVAVASENVPEIAVSADRGWIRHEAALVRASVRIRFLCR
jgi:ABC-type sugar transport system ATPase subunit